MHTAAASDHPLFILYEAAHIEVFRSPGLVARLNDPTEWSKKGLRPAASTPGFGYVMLVEGVGSRELDDAMPDVVDIATAASSGTCEGGVYRLAYLLEAA